MCHQQFRRGTNVQIPTFKCSYYPAPNIILKYKVLKGKSSSDFHGYTCNLKFPTLVSRDAQGSFTLCVLHTATILVFDRVLVWLSQVRLCPTQFDQSTPCSAIPEAPSGGGMPARCSRPPTLRRSVGWSCRVRCTAGSTGSA